MAEQKAFKKLFLNRTVLDTLRLYLDPKQDFLEQMLANKLLTKDEVFVLQTLPWPSNRNELMQMLVKKQWSQASFSSLCDVIGETNEEVLSQTLKEKAALILQEELEVDEMHTQINDITNNVKSNGLNLQALNEINITLRDKDGELRKLRKERMTLAASLEVVANERDHFQGLYSALDYAVSHWLAGLEMEHSNDDVTKSLAELKSKMAEQKMGIAAMKNTHIKMHGQIENQKNEMEGLAEKNKELGAENEKLKKDFEELINETKCQIQALEKKWRDEKSKREKMEKSMKFMESINIESNRTAEKGFNQMKSHLNDALKKIEIATKEKEAAVQELTDIRDKTRKLLFKLNLTNDIDDVSLALEHARDIAYTHRGTNIARHNMTASAPKPPNENEDKIVSKEIGSTPFGLSGRRLDVQESKCKVCGKSFSEIANYEGACVYHLPGSKRLNTGTKLEVWSCCKSRETMKGCQLKRHQAI